MPGFRKINKLFHQMDSDIKSMKRERYLSNASDNHSYYGYDNHSDCHDDNHNDCDDIVICTHKAIGQFIRGHCGRLFFKILYTKSTSTTDTDKCCIDSCSKTYNVICDDDNTHHHNHHHNKHNQHNKAYDCLSYRLPYYIEYYFPTMNNHCESIPTSIIISCMDKLQTIEYTGKVRRYVSCCDELYFLELPDTREVRISNPEKLIPIRVKTPTNEGQTGNVSTDCNRCYVSDIDKIRYSNTYRVSCQTTEKTNYLTSDMVGVRAVPLDILVDPNANANTPCNTQCNTPCNTQCNAKKYIHLVDVCYFNHYNQ